MTGGQHAVAGLPGASRIGDLGSAEHSRNMPWDRLGRSPCTKVACRGPAAWVVAAVAAGSRCAGWASPPVNRAGCRRHRSRFRLMAPARSNKPGTKALVSGRWSRGAAAVAYLNKIFALSLSHERLQLRGRERVDEPGL